MNATDYDPTIIQEFARRTVRQARLTLILTPLAGALALGAIATGAAEGGPEPTMVFVPAVIGALIGYLIGRERAFHLRLGAQTALCQMQIEFNTRLGAHASQQLNQRVAPAPAAPLPRTHSTVPQ